MRDNINVILCEMADANISNISNIFDTITMKADNTISFTSVVFVNGIEWDFTRFTLHFYLEKVDEDLITYLGSVEFDNDRSNDENTVNTNKNNHLIGKYNHSSHTISDMRYDNLYVPGPGSYELHVYRYNEDENVDLTEMDLSVCIEYAKDEKIVAVYPFRVVEE